MISYETAKKLKDAGFPYIQKKVAFNLYEKAWKYIPSEESGPIATDQQLVPTLSELIKACGERFVALRHWDLEKADIELSEKIIGYDSSWMAETYERQGFGSTPEEAVAHLWLALNKK